MSAKTIILRELGYLVIAALLVALSVLIAGTFFRIWMHEWDLLLLLVFIFYLIIGFYRYMNHLARKYRQDNDGEAPIR